eukprot:5029616-Pyramimonas_sp.AAC.1
MLIGIAGAAVGLPERGADGGGAGKRGGTRAEHRHRRHSTLHGGVRRARARLRPAHRPSAQGEQSNRLTHDALLPLRRASMAPPVSS